MDIVTFMIAFVIIGFCLWLVITYIPMPAPMPQVLIVIVVILMIILLARLLLGGGPVLRLR